MYQPMIVSYKNREAEVDIVCGAGNSALQIVFENSVQMNKVPTLYLQNHFYLIVYQLCIGLGGSRERAKHPFLHTGGHH